MPLALGKEKVLPDIPVDIDPSEAVARADVLWSIPSPKIATPADTNKTLPSINAENVLSEEEMNQLHELWNGVGLSARAHRRRHRGQCHTPRRIPAPISIPKPENDPLTLIVSSNDLPITSTTPTTGTRKRWGFFSARPISETPEAEKKTPGALEKLRAAAQDRLKKKLRYAKSAPDIGDQAVSLRRGGAFRPAAAMLVEATPKVIRTSRPCKRTSPGELLSPEAVLQQDDMDENAIYFTVDASQGSVEFVPITAIPNSPNSLGRADSPLLHRQISLDQLSSAAQQVTATLTTMECLSSEVVHPIDELHAYLEL